MKQYDVSEEEFYARLDHGEMFEFVQVEDDQYEYRFLWIRDGVVVIVDEEDMDKPNHYLEVDRRMATDADFDLLQVSITNDKKTLADKTTLLSQRDK